MAEKQIKPYGLWDSSISAESLAGSIRLEDVQFDSDGSIAWLESVDGKTSLQFQSGGDAPKIISNGLKVGGTVGYGGGDFTIRGGTAVFASKGRLYKVSAECGLPEAITPEFGDVASPTISPDGTKLLFVSSIERKDCLAIAAMDGEGWPKQLSTGADFYMQPAWHPSGKLIAWIEWDHPEMPWDGTRLMLAELVDGMLVNKERIFGSSEIPVFQPTFSPDGKFLAFMAGDGELDTLYLLNLEDMTIKPIVSNRVLVDPAWIQGIRNFEWGKGSDKLYYLSSNKGIRTINVVVLATGESTLVETGPYKWIEQLSVSPVDDSLLFIGSSPQVPNRVVHLNKNHSTILKRSSPENVDLAFLPDPQAIEWQAPDGSIVHGLFFPPSSPANIGTGLPPAIVSIHGGPTSARVWEYSDQARFFTSRGYGYLEVNHRGSTGYGRAYMLKLRKQWGKVDVEDAAGGAKALGALGLADPARLVVMGGSAGGYTVLNSMIHFPGVFKAGINFYGVANLFDFIIGTHKFEERYNDSLVGVLPEAAEKFKAWSPVFQADKIKDPIAVFQGEEDKVVPMEHSEQIVAILKANKVPHIYKLYPGEGHGFRKAENIQDFYNSIDTFLKLHVLF